MSKGKWKNRICTCTAKKRCKSCYDRDRRLQKNAGTWKKTRPVGDQREIMRKTIREQKLALNKILAHRQKEVDEWVKWVKAGTKAYRAKRSAAYLRNVERYGEWKAKRIAMAITRK